MIRFESVVARYAQTDSGAPSISTSNSVAAEHPHLHIQRGQFVALLGPSGCGKTTTLKLINRLIEPSVGEVFVDSKPIKNQNPISLRRSIGYAAQQFGLLPHWSVAQNIGIVPKLLGWSKPDITLRVQQLMQQLQLPPTQFASRLPHHLSGGQQQRVSLARALAARPKLLLLDEPLAALDPVTRDRLQRLLKNLHQQLSLTTILVTHDVTEALLLADRIVVMKAGQVIADASPKNLVASPGSSELTQMLETPRRQLQALGQFWKAPNP